MSPQTSHMQRTTPHACRPRLRSRSAALSPGFSLAEMMIALAILGFGLLVIGAALPVGLKYERDMVDRSNGQAAAEYALDLIEQSVRLSKNPTDGTTGSVRYYADLFQPRDTTGALSADPTLPGQMWEPHIKVRPLLPTTIDPRDLTIERLPNDRATPAAALEVQIYNWFQNAPFTDTPYQERDGVAFADAYGNWTAPMLPSIAGVYPPVSSVTGSSVADFLVSMGGTADPYKQRSTTIPLRRQAVDRQIGWVAFYRRASYAQGSDPNLYEVITVVTRRPEGSFFPWQALAAGDNSLQKSLLPIPKMVYFEALSAASKPAWVPIAKPTPYEVDRILDPNFREPQTLVLECAADDGPLLPAGSIFIPAANDDVLSLENGAGARRARYSGLVPHSPDALPIYEVLKNERRQDGLWDITVKNNGYYPWALNDDYKRFWPAWVIPPAFKETQTNSSGTIVPVYDSKTPILAVSRRMVRFAEIP